MGFGAVRRLKLRLDNLQWICYACRYCSCDTTGKQSIERETDSSFNHGTNSYTDTGRKTISYMHFRRFANFFVFVVSTYLRDSIRRAVMVRATLAAAADPPRKSDTIERRVEAVSGISSSISIFADNFVLWRFLRLLLVMNAGWSSLLAEVR